MPEFDYTTLSNAQRALNDIGRTRKIGDLGPFVTLANTMAELAPHGWLTTASGYAGQRYNYSLRGTSLVMTWSGSKPREWVIDGASRPPDGEEQLFWLLRDMEKLLDETLRGNRRESRLWR